MRARAAALAVLLAAAFLVLLVLVQHGWSPLARIDGSAQDRLHAVAVGSPWFVRGMKAVSSLGTISVYAVAGALLAGHLLHRGRARAAVFVVVTVLGGSLLNTSVKAAVDRARPLLADPVASAGHSAFPSGHAQGVAVAATVLLLVLWPAPRRAVLLAVGWALLMGFSRVALGVHYVTDVLGGYLLGLAWVAACAAALPPWRTAQV